MARLLIWVFMLCLTRPSSAATYYIATTGDDTTGNGSIETPWRTFQKAANMVAAGDTVYARGGTYQEYWTESTNGTSGNRIMFASYPGESAIIDGSGIAKGTSNNWVVRIDGDSITLDDLEVTQCAWDCVIFWSGANNGIANNLRVHDGYRIGIVFYSNVNGTASNNHIYNQYDFNQGGGNADCIEISTSGGSHTWINNIVHDCSDDGIDAWVSVGNTIRGNISYHNGYVPGTSVTAGDGNGFKLGSGGGNIVSDNIAWNNRSRGFDDNTGTNNVLYNNTAINNASHNYRFTASGAVLINNISYGSLGTVSGVTQTTNSWNLGISDPSFVQITDPTLPTFANLGADSAAVDIGTEIEGYSYNGSAPDLGAHETVTPASCVVENGDASTLRITFNNARYSPLLPASPAYGPSAFTSRIGGANNTVTGATRVDNNSIYLSLRTAVQNGDVVDYSYSTTAGNVTDSSNVGGTYQRLNAITNQSCTNNVTGGNH